jgi:hypothetical protein
MPLTQFPNGVASFGIPVLGAGGEETITTGNVFFVDSGATNASDNTAQGTSPNRPFATIDYAIGRCTANNGDIIFVMPGHAETITASDIALDVAGVWVRGLGWGASRPTLTFSAAGSTIAMSAASTRISNLRLVPGAASVLAAVTMTGDDLIVENCETVVHATSEFVSLLSVGTVATPTTGSDRSIIRNNKLNSLAAAGATSGILLTGSDDLTIVGNVITGHFGEHAIDNTTIPSVDECLRANISYNFIKNDSTTGGDLVIEMDANATGIFAHNMLSGGLATTAANYDIGNMSSLESYIVDDAGVDVHGIALGTAAV